MTYIFLLYLLRVVHLMHVVSAAEQNENILFPFSAAVRYLHTDENAHFGYSVASYVGQSQSFCLVGAPQASDDGLSELSASARSGPTGLVYRLDLDPNLPDCSVVPIATTNDARKDHGTPQPGGECF